MFVFIQYHESVEIDARDPDNFPRSSLLTENRSGEKKKQNGEEHDHPVKQISGYFSKTGIFHFFPALMKKLKSFS